MEVVITIDVERLYENAEQGTYNFLSLLKDFGIKGTFFITGDIMTNHPEIVEQIANAQHEIASHGYTHPGYIDQFRLPYLTDLGLEEAKKEIEKSKQIFEQFGYKVYGFRSPGFRINKPTQKLIGQYFKYDSSIINFFFTSTKYKRLSRVPTIIENTIEIPVSNLNIFRIPLGTSYFLPIGAKLLTKCLDLLGTTGPIILYFHCFDLVRLNHDCLPHSWLKKKYYFEKCGPKNIDFFRTIFSYFKNKGTTFKTCRDISETLRGV